VYALGYVRAVPEKAEMALTTARRQSGASRPALPLPRGVRSLLDEVDARIARIPTRLNEYGFDAFGLEPSHTRWMMLPMLWIYRHYLRVETRGLERVPPGRVLLIANHAGNTFAWDGAMLATALFAEAEPPRIVRGMGEFFLPTLPFFNVWMQRVGSVVGTPENCAQLLARDEAIMVFPEGERGFVKPYWQRYQLQRFGLGFMRLALETRTPIVPVGIVGAEEQSPAIANLRGLGRLFGSPAFPVTPTLSVPDSASPAPCAWDDACAEGAKVDGTLVSRPQGTEPDAMVPSVVMLAEPAQVESAVFSTLPRPTLAFVSVSQDGSL
jgi:1-acyl-sn-glycerol-3-phosphate acyltransferase